VIIQPVRFPYTVVDSTAASLMPRLAFTLSHGQRSIDFMGLLDTGAAVNVLPYSVGVALGADWGQQRAAIPLTGSLGRVEARALACGPRIRNSRRMAPSTSSSPGCKPRTRQ